MKVVYKETNGTVAVIHTVANSINPSTGQQWTVEELAKKDVPTGSKYKIIEDSDLPSNRNFRDAWVVDESDLTDGVGE
tara:strand:- start:303 stop:536 length:234 start_codon:yes stop_codon:yes gene_type:complete